MFVRTYDAVRKVIEELEATSNHDEGICYNNFVVPIVHPWFVFKFWCFASYDFVAFQAT